MRVTTFNVNFGLGGELQTLEAIGEGDPDLILLQETTPQWEASIRNRYRDRYPFIAFRHCCGAGGLGVLSKVRLETAEYLEPTSGWFPALRVVLDGPLGRLQALSVHLHPPVSETGSVVSGYFTTSPIRKAELESFCSRLGRDVTLVVGDFNEADGEAVRFLQDQGFRSALPEFAPGQETWRWPLPVGSLSSRLDHIFYGPGLEPLSVVVLEAGKSDHLPVTGLFARARPTTGGPVQRSPGSVSLSP